MTLFEGKKKEKVCADYAAPAYFVTTETMTDQNERVDVNPRRELRPIRTSAEGHEANKPMRRRGENFFSFQLRVLFKTLGRLHSCSLL